MDMHATAAKAADNFPLQQSGTFSGRPGIAPEAEGLRGGAQPLQVVFVFLPGNVPWMRVANQHLPLVLGPAECNGTLAERVLALRALGILEHLPHGRLAHIQVGAALQMAGSNFLACLDAHGFVSSLPFKAMLASILTIPAATDPQSHLPAAPAVEEGQRGIHLRNTLRGSFPAGPHRRRHPHLSAATTGSAAFLIFVFHAESPPCARLPG